MPHHHGIVQEVENLLPEIEQDLERLAINARATNQPYGMQPVGYGQPGGMGMGMGMGMGGGMGGMGMGGMGAMGGMGGMGGMPGQMGYMGAYGSAPSSSQGAQPVYVVNMQGSQGQQQRGIPSTAAYGQPNTPYGQAYIDSGDGRPAMVYGGGQPGYQPQYQQQALQPGYQQNYPQQGYPQNIQQAPQMVPQQGYPPNSQQAPQMAPQQCYPPNTQQAPQMAPQQGYPPNTQQAPQMAPQQGYPPSAQQAPQTAPQQANTANRQFAQPVPQQPPQGLPLQNAMPTPPPTAQPTPQTAPAQPQNYGPSPQQTPQPNSQQGYPSASEPGAQQNAQRSYSVSPQPSQQGYPIATPPSSQQLYPVASQASSQQRSSVSSQQSSLSTNKASNFPTELPLREAAELPTPPLLNDKGYPFNSAFSSPQSLRYMIPGSQQVQSSVNASTFGMYKAQNFPTYLNPGDTMVRYEPISAKAHDHHHALKALNGSNHSREALSAILGTYIATKEAHGTSLSTGISGRCSRPEIQKYDGLMKKVEALSHDYIQKHKSLPPAWAEAVGPHRRHIFAELYNSNELVRAFSQEMTGGPFTLPELDTYALGTTKTSNFFTVRASTRPTNLNASFSTLSQVRTVVLVDDSGSMTESGHLSWSSSDSRGGYPESRWVQARKLLAGIAPLVAMQNPHGIDLHFLNRVPFYSGLRTSAAVVQAFDFDVPQNGTPTGQRINDILDAYMSTLRYYRALLPLNLIVITDGEASDEEVLHWAIEEHVTKIVHRGFPAHQFGVEFVQVGDCRHATRHLERLEEEVSRHHHRFQRDVVGVTPATRIADMNPDKMLAICVGGIDARLNGYMRTKGVNV